MRTPFWPIVLSLTLFAALPACAKKHSNDDAKSDPSASDTAGKPAGEGSHGNLDDILDGKIQAPKPAPPGEINIPAPKVNEVPADIIPESTSPANQSEPPQPAAPAEPRRPLQATVEKTGLSGYTDENGEGIPMSGRMAPTAPLRGNAATDGFNLGADANPDSADRELMVEWDRWRNRFLRAVQMHVQAGVNHPDFDEDRPRVRFDPMTGARMPYFPLGTETWFDCDITRDRRIKRLVIVKPSGVPEYDRAVEDGIRQLDGTSILEFPSRSKRQVVTQHAAIRTAQTSDYQYHHFGDVERYREQQR